MDLNLENYLIENEPELCWIVETKNIWASSSQHDEPQISNRWAFLFGQVFGTTSEGI